VLVLALISPALASSQQGQPQVRARKQAGRISSALFRTVMQTVAEGWNLRAVVWRVGGRLSGSHPDQGQTLW
jgi:hypothetical protein